MSLFALMYLLFYTYCLVATFSKNIVWGIWLYQMQYFLNPQTRWWSNGLPSLRWSFMVAVCMLAAYCIKSQKYTANKIFDVPQGKWFVMNLIMIVSISFWAVWPQVHSKLLQDHIKLLIFIFIAYKTIDTPERFEGTMWTLMLGSYYIGYETKNKGRNSDGRVEGTGAADTGGDGNYTAAALIAVIPLMLYFVAKNKGWKRYLALILLGYTMLGVLLINSRGSFVGLVGSCTYMFFFVFNNTTMKERFQVMVIILLGFCMFLQVADDAFWERMHSMLGGGEEEEEVEGDGGRTICWNGAIEMVKDYPLGLGAWGYQWMSPYYLPPEVMPRGKTRRAVHSLYFQTLSDRGYAGTAVWGFLVLSNFLYIRKIKRHLFKKGERSLYFQALALESGLIAFLIAGVFVNRLYAEILYWLMLFIGCFGNIYMIKGYNSKGVIPSSDKARHKKK